MVVEGNRLAGIECGAMAVIAGGLTLAHAGGREHGDHAGERYQAGKGERGSPTRKGTAVHRETSW
jgi:hypothetical protein